jgi:hypothetical protein
MSLGYLTNDCHAQSGPASGPGRVAAGKALEGLVGDVGREPGSLVGDVKADAGVHWLRAKHDLARPVPERIVDEISEGLPDAQRIGVDH